MSHSPSRHLLGGLVLAFSLATVGVGAGALGASPAGASTADSTGSPPVTKPDHVTVKAGQGAFAQVLANDSDPDGDDLAVCRVTQPKTEDLFVFAGQDGIEVETSPDVKAKTYTITYYACDYTYLTAGTLTVTVKPLPKVKDVIVRKVKGRLGKLRVFNPNKTTVILGYGDFSTQEDGELTLKGRSNTVFTVHRHTVDYIAVTRRYEQLAGRGHVRNIRLPKGDHLPPPYDGGNGSGGATPVEGRFAAQH